MRKKWGYSINPYYNRKTIPLELLLAWLDRDDALFRFDSLREIAKAIENGDPWKWAEKKEDAE